MSDYFSEYTSFIGNKGLPSPADTPYETPAFLRSKRSSRATTIDTKSREQSSSPPPLPPDPTEQAEKSRDGRYSALDPRRFTPTLHASLVAEILSLRRELDSKNHLVENLETSLATAKHDNENLSEQLNTSAKEIRVARAQVQQMESGTYDALDTISRERNAAQHAADELRLRLDVANKKVSLQDDDAERTQAIWEREKNSWDNERRQFERRIHVTETRLRTLVEEMVSQQSQQTVHKSLEETEDKSRFQDSGLGDASDDEVEPAHRRQISNASLKSSKGRYSRDAVHTTPEPTALGISLADELDDEEEFEADEHEIDNEFDYHEAVRQTMDSRQSNYTGDIESKAKRVLGLTDEIPSSPVSRSHSRFGSQDNTRRPSVDSFIHKRSASEQSNISDSPRKYEFEARPLSMVPEVPVEVMVQKTRMQYVDTGYQPSPPPSPVREKPSIIAPAINIEPAEAVVPTHTLSPPDTPELHDTASLTQTASYVNSATQTDVIAQGDQRPRSNTDSLQLPVLVPSIAIHPPTSRPTTPRQYALPPGTKNVSTQTALPWSSADASVQTEEIRIDLRMNKLPLHLQPSYVLQQVPEPTYTRTSRDEDGLGSAKILETISMSQLTRSATPVDTPTDNVGVSLSRDGSSKDLRSMPLKAITLPKPTLAPAFSMSDKTEPKSQGPLNRSSQFGVTHENRTSRLLADMSDESDNSDTEVEYRAHRKAGRFTPTEHSRNIPEDKELSPERRPLTSESNDAAPAPSIASSREGAQKARRRPPPKLNTYTSARSRSPSFGSAGSSGWSAQPAMPPYPIPKRSSSRQPPFAYSDGSWSPVDVFETRASTKNRESYDKQQSLRKVQSTTSIRQSKSKMSPRKRGRRVRSPDLTPVQSMAFESPAPTDFPIPELPTPLQHGPSSDYQWGSRSSRPANTSISSMPLGEESSLVDSIAATMVGEWMWKYIRKRKSFGVTESTEDFAQANQEGILDIPGMSTRHKRWVWLSPYEKTIMWDSKQPTSGTALLGKKGRKLIIQSVLDVKDTTPLPKKPELDSVHNRSILILTPERALKFTTINAERHHYWMTALSFLAESNRLESQLPPLPLVPPVPQRAPPPPPIVNRQKTGSPAFGRSHVRDSVRLAKVKVPSNAKEQAGFPRSAEAALPSHEDEGADFPAIPRLYSNTSKHQRKRSNTSPRLPPALNTLRSFSSTAVSSSSSQPYTRPSGSATSPDRLNFFEATGTVRMEAFVDPNVKNGVLYVPAPPSAPAAAQPPRRRRGDSNLSATTADKRRAGYVFDDDGMDPFRGF